MKDNFYYLLQVPLPTCKKGKLSSTNHYKYYYQHVRIIAVYLDYLPYVPLPTGTNRSLPLLQYLLQVPPFSKQISVIASITEPTTGTTTNT